MDEAVPSHAAATARAQVTARRVHGVPPDEASAEPYIGLVTRTIAFAIDAAVINAVAILVGAVVALVFSILPASSDRHEILVAVGAVAFVLWVTGYFLAFWTAAGQTPGNRVMQIKVVRADGSRLRPRHAIARMAGIVLSLPLLAGFIPILFTKRRRGLADWLAGTVVVGTAREDAAPR